MKLTSDEVYFKKISKIKYKYEYLSKNENSDVVIVGGGITGAITAYFQAKSGANVVVLEKNIIGYGSTSATTAILEYQIDKDLSELEKMIGRKEAIKCFKLCKEAIKDIESMSQEIDKFNKDNDIEFNREKSIYFSDKIIDKKDMLLEYNKRKEAGFNVKYLDNNKVINLKTGIDLDDGAAVINPYAFTTELFNMLSKLPNVSIYENTEVSKIIENKDYLTIATSNGFDVNAKKCILATGFETVKYLSHHPETLYKTFTIITEPIEELSENDICFTARDMESPYHYLRFTKDKRIVFGGEDVKYNIFCENKKNLKKIARRKYNKLYNKLIDLFPNIKNIKIEYCFNGTFADTVDTLPIIDEFPNMSNVFCNLGFGANGILYSVIGAKMLKNFLKEKYDGYMYLFRINR